MATKVGSVSNSNFTAPHAHRPVCFFVIARSFVTRRLSVLLRTCGERGKRTGVPASTPRNSRRLMIFPEAQDAASYRLNVTCWKGVLMSGSISTKLNMSITDAAKQLRPPGLLRQGEKLSGHAAAEHLVPLV